MADYSAYLKLQEQAAKSHQGDLGGPTLANAYYGRALCLAKLGQKAQALRDLNQCIRLGPVDEQMSERDASLVPRAKVAKMLLKQAYPELGGAEEDRDAIVAAAKRAAEAKRAASQQQTSSEDEPVYEGKVWRVPITALEPALAKVARRRAGSRLTSPHLHLAPSRPISPHLAPSRLISPHSHKQPHNIS